VNGERHRSTIGCKGGRAAAAQSPPLLARDPGFPYRRRHVPGDGTHGLVAGRGASNISGGITMVRKVLFWVGWLLLAIYAGIFAAQIFVLQDLPAIAYWKWGVLLATCVLIFFARNRDDAFAHHLPH
jgi:hypothetical protein